jgi:hypothetical protein
VAYAADALVALLRGERPEKEPEVCLEGDLAAFERSHAEPGARMELVGIGPIPVTIARGLLNDGRVSILSREGAEITRITSPKRTGVNVVGAGSPVANSRTRSPRPGSESQREPQASAAGARADQGCGSQPLRA